MNRQLNGKYLNIFLFVLLFSVMIISRVQAQEGSVHSRSKTQARPALSGPVSVYEGEHSIVHYTTEGEDKVPDQDEDQDGHPDYVQAVAEAFDFSWQQIVIEEGWQAPIPDQAEGGDSRFDIYLQDQAPYIMGYVETYGGFVGDNPLTEMIEQDVAYGYLSLDNDFSAQQFGEDLTSLEMMRTTAAHELHHGVQTAYNENNIQKWLYEASSVWFEDQIYPEIGDAKNYLPDYMAAPDLCLPSVGRDEMDVRWYGSWIFLRYISEHYGGPNTIRHLWEEMILEDGMEAIETILAEQDTTLSETIVNFSVANLVQADCPSNTPYCYAQGSDYPPPYLEKTIHLKPGEVKTFLPRDGVQQWGADYLKLTAQNPIKFRFRGSPTGVWQLRGVGLQGEEATIIPLGISELNTIDPTTFENFYLVVVNTAPVQEEADCRYHNYTFSFADESYPRAIKAPLVPPDPDPYVPPPFFGDAEEEIISILEGGTDIDEDKTPFKVFYPDYLPTGYTFAQIVSHTAEDLGEWASDYAPDGKLLIALNYRGPERETFLSITQTPTEYTTIRDWVIAQDYFENDIRLINNTPVYLVDYSDDEGPLSSASLVHKGIFIVMDGSFDFIEMQHIVAGFLIHNP